jgi:hypothetical protein
MNLKKGKIVKNSKNIEKKKISKSKKRKRFLSSESKICSIAEEMIKPKNS